MHQFALWAPFLVRAYGALPVHSNGSLVNGSGAWEGEKARIKENGFTKKLFECVPDLRAQLRKPWPANYSDAVTETASCKDMVRIWGRDRGLDCDYVQNCVPVAACVSGKSKANAGCGFDGLSLHIQLGRDAGALGRFIADLGERRRESVTSSYGIAMASHVEHSLDVARLYGEKEIPIRRLRDFMLIFDPKLDRPVSGGHAYCNIFQLKTVRLLLHHVPSDLYFVHFAVEDLRTVRRCGGHPYPIVTSPLPLGGWNATIGGVLKQPLWRCIENGMKGEDCHAVLRYG
ncbi:hypothetical protein DCS_04574 [Drechmeria coniospora]|uniref:Uncharacterized protein n=1 Tax=Drechmeria coniospora TaxID=98403 RepID=A0A151GKC2_DRECN|nr:hypothetical protein DCS_04574 [Drechmeria coniospora]KYK57563.1 hypothetical protein DCS_04574 [Drechmeria coniospora]